MAQCDRTECALGRGYNFGKALTAIMEGFPPPGSPRVGSYSICPICGEDPIDCEGHKICDVCGKPWTECHGHGETVYHLTDLPLAPCSIAAEGARR